LPDDYYVEGVLAYGTWKPTIHESLLQSLNKLQMPQQLTHPESGFINSICEFWMDGKRYWFFSAYGGAILSEWTHLACLFDSKQNILLGSSGGLKPGAKSLEIIIPTYSYAVESSAKAYSIDESLKYYSDPTLSKKLADSMAQKHVVHTGPTMTYQAMLGETWEDIVKWSDEGYLAVEMEASTLLAVSKHFDVPGSAMIFIGDNLIEKQTVHDDSYKETKHLQEDVKSDMFDAALQSLRNLN
jgi:purine-nucleoside phosphorylase